MNKVNRVPSVVLTTSGIKPSSIQRRLVKPALTTENMASSSLNWLKPKKTVKKVKQKVRYVPVPIDANRFQPISSDEEDEEDNMETEETSSRTKTTATANERRPPPIIIHGRNITHNRLRELFADCDNGYQVRYTREKTLVYPNTTDIHTTMKNKLTAGKVEFHTFTPKGLKTSTFVIKGLDNNPEPESVLAELKSCKIEATNVRKMGPNTKRPHYIVTVADSETVESLNKKCRAILNVRVRFEKYLNKKKMTQCHRCQAWGHGTRNCNLEPTCVRCSQYHWTRDCPHKPDPTYIPKCANCGKQGHAASQTTCEVYIAKVTRIEELQEERRQKVANKRAKLAPAPIPKVNPWTQPKKPTGESIVFTNKSFPPLPTPSTSAANSPILTRQTPTKTKIPETSSMTEFCKINAEISRLNKNVNMKNLLIILKELNNALEKCQSQQEKLFVCIDVLSKMGDAGYEL